ncbi:hypothetical protein FH972_023011 [Carpinus fangiana]|uniref:Uncharacterized protein n=1 Tax=Carpinus fangiana TaxID=176857 RepID=A0A5N6KTY3_9ROSI|nr:hypothetical protein FH972_023011 [Carpinus fangiana]
MAALSDPKQLAGQLSAINPDSFGDDESARLALLAEAQKLVRRLEDPFEAIMRMTYGEPTLICALLIADRMRLFSLLGPESSPPQNAASLAAKIGAEHDLVTRVLRHLAAGGVVAELPGQNYKTTRLSAMLADSDNCVGFREVANRYMPIFAAAPAWLEEHNYQCPRDAANAVFQKALGTPGQTFWDWLQMPEHRHASDEFGRLMRLGLQESKTWLDVRDLTSLVQGWDGQSPLLVDVGGSTGKDALDFKTRFSDNNATIVVQDLPPTIELAKSRTNVPNGIDFQPHDFFKAQPVKASRIYFMGSILHDWPDADARKILANVAAAMKKDYSILLLSENVLPEYQCSLRMSAIDICMLTELGAAERTDVQWTELLAEAGLKVTTIDSTPGFGRSLIQAELS